MPVVNFFDIIELATTYAVKHDSIDMAHFMGTRSPKIWSLTSGMLNFQSIYVVAKKVILLSKEKYDSTVHLLFDWF